MDGLCLWIQAPPGEGRPPYLVIPETLRRYGWIHREWMISNGCPLKWMVSFMENPTKMDDLEVSPLLKTGIK